MVTFAHRKALHPDLEVQFIHFRILESLKGRLPGYTTYKKKTSFF